MDQKIPYQPTNRLSKTPRDVADDVGLSSHSALLSELNRRITVNKLNPRDGANTHMLPGDTNQIIPLKQTEIAGFQILSSAKNPSFSDN